MTPNVIAALGGQRVFGTRAAQVDLLEEVERGLPVRAYEAVAEALELTPVEEDRLLQVSLRTRARWKRRARLDVATSDRLVRLARILALAVLVLESREHAVAWLRESSPALGGRAPLAAVASDPGAEKVSNMLYQMEHGGLCVTLTVFRPGSKILLEQVLMKTFCRSSLKSYCSSPKIDPEIRSA